MRFYHYRSLKNDDHIQHLFNYLEQKIWFNRLDMLNDPFEKNHIAQLSTGELFSGDFFNKFGVICLTVDESNIPMWAHYGDNHKGYCVIFEIDFNLIYLDFKEDYEKTDKKEYSLHEYENNYLKKLHDREEILSFNLNQDPDKKFYFTRVIYKEERPVLKKPNLKAQKEMSIYDLEKYKINNSIGVKYIQWEYENEYRLISNTNSHDAGLLNLNTMLISNKPKPFINIVGIIFGCNFDKNIEERKLKIDKREIEKYCEKQNITFYKSEPLERSYKIKVSEYRS